MNRALLNPFEAADLPKAIQDYLEPDAGHATCMRFNRHGNLLAVGTTLGSVIVWDFDTHTIATKLPPPSVAAPPSNNTPASTDAAADANNINSNNDDDNKNNNNSNNSSSSAAPSTTAATANTSAAANATAASGSTAHAAAVATAPVANSSSNAPPHPPHASANPVSAVAFPAPGNASAILVAHRSGLLRLFDTLSTAVQTELSCPFSIHALDAHPRDPSVAVLTPHDGFPHLVRLRRGRYTLPQTLNSDDEPDVDAENGHAHAVDAGSDSVGRDDDDSDDVPAETGTSGRGRSRGRPRGKARGSGRGRGRGWRGEAAVLEARRRKANDMRMQVDMERTLDFRKLRLDAPSCATAEQPHFTSPPPPPSTEYANKCIPGFRRPARALRLAPLRAPSDPPGGDPAPKQHHLAKRRWPAYAVALTRDGRFALRTGPTGLIHVFRLHGVLVRSGRGGVDSAACSDGEEEEEEEEDGYDDNGEEGDAMDTGRTDEARRSPRKERTLRPECVAMYGVPGSAFIRSIHLAPRKPVLLVVSADKIVRKFSLSQLIPADGKRCSLPTDSRAGGAGSSGSAAGNGSSSSVVEVEEVTAARPDGVQMLHADKTFAEVVNRSQCRCAVLSRDGEFVLGGMDGADHRINIWRMDGHLEVTLEGPKEGIAELLWHPVRPVVASLGMGGGGVYVWAKNFSENWSAFATQFAELEANEEYEEKEDEFDIVDEDSDGTPGDDLAKAESADVDVESVDAAWFESDSDDGDSFFYVPAVPQREQDDPADQGLADKIIMARMGAKERGVVINIEQGKVTKKKRVRSASERGPGRPRKTRARVAATGAGSVANGAVMTDVGGDADADADAEGESERDAMQENSSASGGDEVVVVPDG